MTALGVGVIVHPANGMPFLQETRRCSDCAHFDAPMMRCLVSREHPTTAGGWPACIRFQRRGITGRIAALVARHALPVGLAGLGVIIAYPLHLLLS